MNTKSTPSTAAIAPASATAVSDSIWTQMNSVSLALAA